MLFEQDQKSIELGEVVSEKSDPRHRPYFHQADGMWTQDRTLHKRDEDLTKTTIYGSERRKDCDVSSPVTIGTIKMTDSDKTSPKNEKQESGIDRDNASDEASDRGQFRHHHEDNIEMGDCEEHRPPKLVTDRTETVETDHDVATDEQADASVNRHDSGNLYAKDVEQNMAVLPEVITSTAVITIDDIQVDDPGVPFSEDQKVLRQLIWKNRRFIPGKGNAAARGAVCDIDVEGANPIAQRVRPGAPKFREKIN